MFGDFLRDASALDRHLVALADVCHAAVKRGLRGIRQAHGDASVGERRGDAAAHGARADDTRFANRIYGRILEHAGSLAGGALGEEGMDQRLRLRRFQARVRKLTLSLAAFGERQGDRGPQRFQDRERCGLIAADLARLQLPGGENRKVLLGSARMPVHPARLSIGAAPHGHPARKSHRAREQVAIYNSIDEPDLQRFGSAHRSSGHQHIDRLRQTHQPGQPLRALGSGDHPDRDLRHAHLGVAHGDAIVRGHGDFNAASERGPMHRDDRRFRAVLDRGQQRVQIGALARRREFGQVGSGDEGLTGADDDDGVHRGVGLRFLDGGREAFRDARGNGVDRGVIDCDDGNLAVAMQPDELVHERRTKLLI